MKTTSQNSCQGLSLDSGVQIGGVSPLINSLLDEMKNVDWSDITPSIEPYTPTHQGYYTSGGRGDQHYGPHHVQTGSPQHQSDAGLQTGSPQHQSGVGSGGRGDQHYGPHHLQTGSPQHQSGVGSGGRGDQHYGPHHLQTGSPQHQSGVGSQQQSQQQMDGRMSHQQLSGPSGRRHRGKNLALVPKEVGNDILNQVRNTIILSFYYCYLFRLWKKFEMMR